MLDLDALVLEPACGERLALTDYRRDFRRHDDEIIGRPGWKFERRQCFEEQNSPSWEAFRRGDRRESLSLLGTRHGHWTKIAREDKERGSVFHRVRVVEEPLTPYVRWELHALRVQSECGMPIRVIGADRVRPLERSGPLPEIVSLGGRVLYEVLYTDEGLLDGAVRFVDPALVQAWESFIAGLYEIGEDAVAYFDRYVANLTDPQQQRG
ncbi:DUF6879 family protein [Embleya scabrispora]|uniref:DUF6879 family protein n=1 Tax=Embleya scabrispora TaxID=159449 RepID=UPI0003A1FAE4|nr:DUF6879 family protein [Embleya scabrispora]MYS86840.1 hypothetical protein [Streptomyces sp. SID5474]